MKAVTCGGWQGPGRVPLSNLDRRHGPDDPQAAKQAEQFFGRLAGEAGRAGVAVDIVAVGQAAVNVPSLGLHRTLAVLSQPISVSQSAVAASFGVLCEHVPCISVEVSVTTRMSCPLGTLHMEWGSASCGSSVCFTGQGSRRVAGHKEAHSCHGLPAQVMLTGTCRLGSPLQ